MKPKDQEELLEELYKPLDDIMQDTNYKVLGIISERVKNIGELSATDAQRLSVLLQSQDLNKIEKIISDNTELSMREIDLIVEKSAQNNDNLAENLYNARNMPKSNFMTNTSLLSAVETAKKSIKDNILNLSSTSALKLVSNDKAVQIKQAYNYAVNRAVFEVQQGLFDYNTAMRPIIKEFAQNGLNVLEYESGYKRRFDSAIRQNVLDGVKQMNMDYRERQGKEYGADHVFISYHAMPAHDHAEINGNDYSAKEWETVSMGLSRQVGTNNCKHYITYGIEGISQNPISENERQSAIENSNKQVTYDTLQTDENGNPIKKTIKKYDGTQVLRKTETNIRQLKDVKNQLLITGDKIGASDVQKKITAKSAYYKKIAGQMGLEIKSERTRVVR